MRLHGGRKLANCFELKIVTERVGVLELLVEHCAQRSIPFPGPQKTAPFLGGGLAQRPLWMKLFRISQQLLTRILGQVVFKELGRVSDT